MKRHVPFAVLLCCLISCVSSCEKAPFLVINTSGSINFTEQGGIQTISFTSNRDWSISSSELWCKVSPSSGVKTEGEVSLTITCYPNSFYESRSAKIRIRSEDLLEVLTVTQDQASRLSVEQKEYVLSSDAQQISIQVEANVDYSVSTDVDWISVSSAGQSDGNIAFNILENDESAEKRIGTIKLSQIGGGLIEYISVIQFRASTDNYLLYWPQFSESIELMCLIWRLAGSPEYSSCRVKSVDESANSFFVSMKGHEAVILAREGGSRGVSYDAVTAYGLHLMISKDGLISFNPLFEESTDDSFNRWSDSHKERMLAAVNDFYQKSHFHEWYQSLAPTRQKAISSFKSRTNIDYQWFDSFFGPKVGLKTQIILSFLIGQHNHGLSVDLTDGGTLLTPVIGSMNQDNNGEPYYAGGLSTVIHEFCHPYCNPLIEEYWELMADKANTVFINVKSEMSSMAYGAPKVMMFETFVRASTISYLASHGYDSKKEELVEKEVRKGFLLVPSLVYALESRVKDYTKYPTMEDFMPEIVKAINDCQL